MALFGMHANAYPIRTQTKWTNEWASESECVHHRFRAGKREYADKMQVHFKYVCLPCDQTLYCSRAWGWCGFHSLRKCLLDTLVVYWSPLWFCALLFFSSYTPSSVSFCSHFMCCFSYAINSSIWICCIMRIASIILFAGCFSFLFVRVFFPVHLCIHLFSAALLFESRTSSHLSLYECWSSEVDKLRIIENNRWINKLQGVNNHTSFFLLSDLQSLVLRFLSVFEFFFLVSDIFSASLIFAATLSCLTHSPGSVF